MIATAMDDDDECERLARRLDKILWQMSRLVKQARDTTRTILLSMASAKFGEPSPAVLQRFRGLAISDDFLPWVERLETATSWGEWLNSM